MVVGLRNEGVFTPPSLEGTLVYPGTIGGVNWGGLAVHPERGLLFTNINKFAWQVRLIPRGESAPGDAEFGPQRGTPYGMSRSFLLSPSGLPCSPPPWGTLVAVDLVEGTVKWEVPLGIFLGLEGLPEAST